MRKVFILQPEILDFREPFYRQLYSLGLNSDVEYVIGVETFHSNTLTQLNQPRIVQVMAKKIRFGGRTLVRHDPPATLIDAADLVTEMKNIRHPYTKGIDSREGIDH